MVINKRTPTWEVKQKARFVISDLQLQAGWSDSLLLIAMGSCMEIELGEI